MSLSLTQYGLILEGLGEDSQDVDSMKDIDLVCKWHSGIEVLREVGDEHYYTTWGIWQKPIWKDLVKQAKEWQKEADELKKQKTEK